MQKGKKSKTAPAIYPQTAAASRLHEPLTEYSRPQFKPVVKNFDYNEFKKISDNVPFTQKEWSDILHISERTLQRYAKDNSVFSFSVADRILQIDKVIKKGVHVFGSMDKFINWIRDNPYMLEGRLSLLSLASIEGIHMVFTQLGRIEQGLFA